MAHLQQKAEKLTASHWAKTLNIFTMTTTTIRYSEIPSFLKEGDFYLALSSDDQTSDYDSKCGINDYEIEIPEECFCQSDSIMTLQCFTKLLKTTAFWGLPAIPVGLIEFCNYNEFSIWMETIDEFCSEVGFAQDLRFIIATKSEGTIPIKFAMQIGRTEVVNHLAPEESRRLVAMLTAAALGRMDYIQMLRSYGHAWDETVCRSAAGNGQLECLHYLLQNGCAYDSLVLSAALHNGHINCVEYALKKGILWPSDIAWHFANQGNLALLTYVVDNNCVLNAEVATTASEYGHILCLEFLLESGCEVESDACFEACRHGHLDCLQLLHTHNVPWDEDCTTVASRFGLLHILQYQHANGCPWNASATEGATTNGHVLCLRYLLDNGCPYSEGTICTAADGLKEPIMCLRCLIEEQGAYLDHHGTVFVRAFTSANHLAVQYLLDQGCPYQNGIKEVHDLCELFLGTRSMIPDYDSNLLKCIQIAHQYQWDMIQCNTVVTKFVHCAHNLLPLCSAYLFDQGIVMLPNELESDDDDNFLAYL